MRSGSLALAMLALCAAIAPAQAQRAAGLKPSEQVWRPAATPSGGTSWALLESTEEVQRESAGMVYSKPRFPQQVRALQGKKIKVSGYMLPLQNGARQSHFVLLAYPPDCPFHLNPAPDQFIEIRVAQPVPVREGVMTVEGVLVLGGEDESGVFYKMTNGREA
jgi:hypothetical protein